MPAGNAFVTDAGTNDKALTWDNGKHPGIESREHVDSEFGSSKLILNDCIRNIIDKRPELGLISHNEDVDAASTAARFYVHRVGDAIEIDIARQAGHRGRDSMLPAK